MNSSFMLAFSTIVMTVFIIAALTMVIAPERYLRWWMRYAVFFRKDADSGTIAQCRIAGVIMMAGAAYVGFFEIFPKLWRAISGG